MENKEKIIEILKANSWKLDADELYADEDYGNVLSESDFEKIANFIVGLEGEKWISVEDRLPLDDKSVWVCCSDSSEVGWYEADEKKWYSEFNPEYIGESCSIRLIDVTNWMPLAKRPQPQKPTPPSEGK